MTGQAIRASREFAGQVRWSDEPAEHARHTVAQRFTVHRGKESCSIICFRELPSCIASTVAVSEREARKAPLGLGALEGRGTTSMARSKAFAAFAAIVLAGSGKNCCLMQILLFMLSSERTPKFAYFVLSMAGSCD